jgi:hypothetical protein
MFHEKIDRLNILIYLSSNYYVINSKEVSVEDNVNIYYYKYPLIIMFFKELTRIKDIKLNRSYDFSRTYSDFEIINFLKFIEKELEDIKIY